MSHALPVHAIHRALLLVSLSAPACGDEVVGYFSDMGEPTGVGLTGADSTGADSTGADSTSSTPASTSEAPAADSTGEPPFVSCYTDDFDGTELDGTRWNTWAEQNSAVAVMAGTVAFTPPSVGVFDTGLVSHINHNFAFRDGWARIRIGTPPSIDRPVSLFLVVDQTPESMFIRISQGSISVQGGTNQAPVFGESFPMTPYPQWLGIRGEGELVHFEISDDGQVWQTISTHEKPSVYDNAAMIIMAQTHGDDPGQETVSVDRYEACL